MLGYKQQISELLYGIFIRQKERHFRPTVVTFKVLQCHHGYLYVCLFHLIVFEQV
jgi:hypothetical protein